MCHNFFLLTHSKDSMYFIILALMGASKDVSFLLQRQFPTLRISTQMA